MGTRKFHVSDLITCSTGKLVSTRHMDGVYDLLNFMTGDSLFIHVLPRAFDVMGPEMYRQHPFLHQVAKELTDYEKVPQDLVKAAIDLDVAKVANTFGEWHQVTSAEHLWNPRNPIEELIEMVGPEKVMVVQIPNPELN